jgi:hypothetical protein
MGDRIGKGIGELAGSPSLIMLQYTPQMEIQMMVGFHRLKGITVGECPDLIKSVFTALSQPWPFTALKMLSDGEGSGRSVSNVHNSHWWIGEDYDIPHDGYYLLATRFLGSVDGVSAL